MASRAGTANGTWHPLKMVWEQVGPTVMRGTKVAQSWGIPVNPLVQKMAAAILKQEWLTLSFIGLMAKGKYDTVGLFALSIFAWEGFSRKCFNGKIWRVPVSLGPENPSDPTYFHRLMSKFDISGEVLDLRVSLLKAEQMQIRETIDGNEEASITGLRTLKRWAEGMGDGTVSGSKEVDAVRRVSSITATQEDGSPQRQGPLAVNTIDRMITEKTCEITKLDAQINELEAKKRASSQTVSIDRLVVITALLWGLQKVPIIGGMSSTIMTVALGVILGNQGYCWAVSKDATITCNVCYQDPTALDGQIRCAVGHILQGEVNAITCQDDITCQADLPSGLTRKNKES